MTYQKKSTNPNVLPPFIQAGIRGILYWMGHRNSIYKSHDIMEGAIVEEITKIIKAHLSTNKEIKCEFPYNKIDPSIKSENGNRTQRADFVIKYKKKFSDGKIKYIFEVKRFKKKYITEILGDIKKLAALNVHNAERYILIISSGKCDLEKRIQSDHHENFSIIWKGKTEFNDCAGKREYYSAHVIKIEAVSKLK